MSKRFGRNHRRKLTNKIKQLESVEVRINAKFENFSEPEKSFETSVVVEMKTNLSLPPTNIVSHEVPDGKFILTALVSG